MMDVTVCIPAYNAEATLGRAIESVRQQSSVPILVVDDRSSDGTTTVAQAYKEFDVRLVSNKFAKGIGGARKTALTEVSSEYFMWLDADDMFLPGRIERMYRKLVETEADMVYDSAKLYDGSDDGFIRDVAIPEFMFKEGAIVRSFERNYLPGPSWFCIRTAAARGIDYDESFVTAEDYDFLLRAISGGLKIVLDPNFGYKQYAYPLSASRDRKRQNEYVRKALLKHDVASIKNLYTKAGLDPCYMYLGLASVMVLLGNPGEVLTAANELESIVAEPRQALETVGPWRLPVKWYASFFAATAWSMKGDWGQCIALLGQCNELTTTAEGCNNIGVAYAKIGDSGSAREHWEAALELYPAYADAVDNLNGQGACYTVMPLRTFSSRSEYVVAT